MKEPQRLTNSYANTLESMNNLIDLYETWNKAEKAEEWRAKLPRTKAVEE